MSMEKKWVYFFGEGGAKDKGLLGGKGANLAEMVRIGLSVPMGFTISTEACNTFYSSDKQWPKGLDHQVKESLSQLEKITGKQFGDPENPLLLSVRSGAKFSMPGMMDTVLNLGLNEAVLKGMIKLFKDERFALDCYRRFINMFGDVVMGVEHKKFEDILTAVKEKAGVQFDHELSIENLKDLVKKYKAVYKESTKDDFPQDPLEQLRLSIDAVFSSWFNTRAFTYRNLNNIPHDLGTAVNVQSMVFGNMGDDCATGVAFTRDPSTGEKVRYGEFLINAQGEDVVAGIRTPQTLDVLKEKMPVLHKELYEVFEKLENHYRDMQDVEFTIERSKLYILQTRSGKRTAPAALKMAVDMVNEGAIPKKEAIMRVSPEQIDQLLHPMLDPKAIKGAKKLGKGLPASPGAGVGQVVFTPDDAVEQQKLKKKVILVRTETTPEDIHGMHAAEGILTARGGMTSHAAVVARGMNKCCVAGSADVRVVDEKSCFIGNVEIKEGEVITLDGSTGNVYLGELPVVKAEVSGDFSILLGWANELKKIGVHTNADSPHDAQVALNFGAEGIGLCRTEHMFFNPKRILRVREMILASDLEGRKAALEKLIPFQRDDFKGLLGIMSGLPVIIRLLDPPLHEFLPQEEREQKIVADEMKISLDVLRTKIESLHEFNPMLGFRGCRLGVVYPEIYMMQVQAIFEASLALIAEGKDPRPEIEIPLVGHLLEYINLKDQIEVLAKETGAFGKVKYTIGTMIEVPRAALTADELAPHVDFMSFGTNDLTQMTCGFSRDDSGVFLDAYVKAGIYGYNPFESIDQEGVGKLMKICVDLARKVKPAIDIGICGEHGGEARSVEFCHRIGLNNVSCSPYRVPVARLAAAQAAIKEMEE